MRKIAVLISLCLVFGLASPTLANSEAKENNAENRYIPVQLLGMNDFHGKLDYSRKIHGKKAGGAAYLATYLKKYEAQNKNTLIVHAGDMIGASPPLSALMQDEPTIRFLNKIGVDVGTAGNHSFDEGVEEFLRIVNGGKHPETGEFEGADFPYVLANVVYKKTHETILPPYVIKKVNGMPIGFIGVVTTDTPTMVVPSGVKEVKFVDEAKAINKYVKKLKDKGVESIVILAHVPGRSAQDGSHPRGEVVKMAKQTNDEVDVIFGGHNHNYINTVVDDKLIVESYSYGTAFSEVKLKIDPKTKDIVEKEANIIRSFKKNVKPDQDIVQFIKKVKEKVDDVINEVVGTAGEMITREQSAAGESALGDLVADSQRLAMDTDFAFMNPGGIREDLQQGDITWGELYAMLPFGNTLVKMELTGKQIKALLEQQWNTNGGSTMLQISGLQYTWDDEAPVGNKLVSMSTAAGEPIKMEKTYTVTVNNFLAEGGDGFTVLTQGKNAVVGPTALDALITYIKSQPSPLKHDIESLIQVK